MVGKARNFYSPTTVALCGSMNVIANAVLLQLLFKMIHYEYVQEHLFVRHSLKRLNFEFDLKILPSCYVRIIKRSFSFIMKTTSLSVALLPVKKLAIMLSRRWTKIAF
jgi:hypothetical protein